MVGFVPCCVPVLYSRCRRKEKKDNHFEVSKNLEIFNSLVKEMEMFYVDTVDVEKTVRRGIDAMLGGLDPYTEYIPEQEMGDFKQMVTGEYGGIGAYIRQRNEKGNVMIVEPLKECRQQKPD